jgi:hypothetical protein
MTASGYIHCWSLGMCCELSNPARSLSTLHSALYGSESWETKFSTNNSLFLKEPETHVKRVASELAISACDIMVSLPTTMPDTEVIALT